MYVIIHEDEKGQKRERHEPSHTGVLAAMAEVATKLIANSVGFTYGGLALPYLLAANGHRYYVERHTKH